MLDIIDRQLITAIQDGLPLSPRPYATIAQQINQTEETVIQRLQNLQNNGTIKRLGVVVKHRSLGFKANAMVVWNVPDDKVREIAQRLADFECVTLCYQRPRRLPDWPYNLFTMIHGKDRVSVLKRLADIVDALDIQDLQHEPLFSTKQFKQRGGRYLNDTPATATIPNIFDFKQKAKQRISPPETEKSAVKISGHYSPLLNPLYG